MKRVLIVKIGAIGDVIMSLPMLQFLKDTEKNVHITWVCGEIPAEILSGVGLVDEVITVHEQRLFKGSFFQKIAELLKIWKKLGARCFDLIVIAHVDLRYRLLTLWLRGKKRSTLRKSKGFHSLEYLRLITDREDLRPSMPIWKKPLPEKLQKHLIVVLAPGGAKNILADNPLRRWPIENYVMLAKDLIDQGIKVILIGAASDGWTESYFADLDVENLIGKTSLSDLIGILAHCDLLITHDSGPLHLAKLACCPVIALFGPTDPRNFVEESEMMHVIWGGEKLACRPCYDGKQFAKCSHNQCMREISPEQVVSLATQKLKKK